MVLPVGKEPGLGTENRAPGEGREARMSFSLRKEVSKRERGEMKTESKQLVWAGQGLTCDQSMMSQVKSKSLGRLLRAQARNINLRNFLEHREKY